jgi:hypothetical protein
MGITWRERPNSRTSTENPRSITLRFQLAGVVDDVLARAYAAAASPLLWDNLYRQDIRLESQGWAHWAIEVPYGPRETKQPEAGECRFSFDTGGGTARITQAKEHIASYKHPELAAPPNHKGAIGVTSDGAAKTVEGCDITVPAFKWTEEWTLPSTTITWTYSQILKALTGRTNDDEFRNFGKGQVLCVGAQGRQSTKDPTIADLTLNFLQSDDFAGLTMGDIEGIVKQGWHYLWVEYWSKEDPASNLLVKVPKAVHVERVYDEGDFELFGVGTGSLDEAPAV